MAADDQRLAGVLAGVHDGQSGDDQAVVTVRIDGDWLVLDNRYLRMLTDAEAINMTALFVLGSEPDAHPPLRRGPPCRTRCPCWTNSTSDQAFAA